MIDFLGLQCCALAELQGFMSNTPKVVVQYCDRNKKALGNNGPRSFILSEARPKGVRFRTTSNFKAYVKKHDLGAIESVNIGRNGNSGNHVKVSIYTPRR
jgi:hypothetical protein